MKSNIKNISILLFLFLLFHGCNEKNSVVQSSTQNINIKNTKEVKKIIEKSQTKEIKPSNEKTVVKQIESPKREPQVTNPRPIKELVKLPKSHPKKQIKRTSTLISKDMINNFDFNIIKKGYESDNTLLIVGGIQGDEPGGFMAASLIATHYDIKKGSVWVVPNLNFYSIIKRSRGPYGDMNRKFADLAKDDPDYETVQKIKSYINDKNVKLIVNLHDGSGFYRPTYEDKEHSPYKWGQCSIIDQESIKTNSYPDLVKLSNEVVKHVNRSLIKDEHKYHLLNTRTNEGDKEMEKTLTYYAIKNGKAAFGNEASKSLPTHQRAYYHLLALEKYMDLMGIEYERKFNLNDTVVKNIIDNDIEITLYDNKINLPLAEIRNILRYFPVKPDGTIDFVPSNPLMSIVREKNEYTIYYGNRRLSKLKADYIDHSNDTKKVKLKVDSKTKEIPFGSKVKVNKNFLVHPIKNYRVNVIGYTNKSKKETNIYIDYKKMQKRFSIDKNGSTYRVEFYTQNKFAGMILVEFSG